MQVSEAVEDYRFALLKLPVGTQRWYLKRLELFSSWCAEQGVDLEHLKRKGIAIYLDHLKTTPSKKTGKLLASASVHGHMRAIRAFLNFCARDEDLQKHLSSSAVKNVPMPKLEKKIIETLTDEQIAVMFAACEKDNYVPHLVIRDRAILSVLLDTGIRASELCGLTLECVVFRQDESYIRVHGKGDKWREVGLGAESSQVLHRYIRYHRPKVKDKHVFIGRFHEPMKFDALKQLLYRLRDLAGLEKSVRVNAHVWRHTFAIRYLANGGDVYKLSRLLGHEHVGITELYLKALKQRDARQEGISVLDNFKGR